MPAARDGCTAAFAGDHKTKIPYGQIVTERYFSVACFCWRSVAAGEVQARPTAGGSFRLILDAGADEHRMQRAKAAAVAPALRVSRLLAAQFLLDMLDKARTRRVNHWVETGDRSAIAADHILVEVPSGRGA